MYSGDYNGQIEAIDNEGTVPMPDSPGLGVDYDRAFIENNATGSVHIYE